MDDKTLVTPERVVVSDRLPIFSERELTFTFAVFSCPSVCRSYRSCARLTGGNFGQYFNAVWYLGHPMTFTENFTEIVQGKPLRRGFKRKRNSQV